MSERASSVGLGFRWQEVRVLLFLQTFVADWDLGEICTVTVGSRDLVRYSSHSVMLAARVFAESELFCLN